MSEGERVKLVRKANKLTLEKFGKQFGMGASSISDIENGRRALTNQTRISICREFNVNETWLRTGEGEMVAPESSFDLEEYIKRRGVTDLEIQILNAYFDLDSDLREKLLQHFKERLTAEQKRPIPVSEDGPKNADEESFMRDVRAMNPRPCLKNAIRSSK